MSTVVSLIVAAIALGTVALLGYAVVLGIRGSARWAVSTWRMGTPSKRGRHVAAPDNRSLESSGRGGK